MNVEITGRHVVITPAIRTYILKRLRKFAKIFGDDISFHVIIDVQKELQTAEILLKSKLLDLTGKGQTDDMYNSIVRAIDKLERQALKHKSKVIEVKRQRAKANSVAERLGSQSSSSRTSAKKSSARASKKKNASIQEEETQRKPMAVEEAVIELNQSDRPFVIFRNSESGAVSVLYRRKDGTLGLVRA
jgi:putative sigma-54 modulation protein